ncbi:MAG: hypothetical protein JXQ92_12405 [Roseivirga sp.]
MIDNGQVIHNEMKEIIYNSEFYLEMTNSEQIEMVSEIDNLNNEQLVQLSLALSISYYAESGAVSDIDWERILHCAATAVGISSIKEILKNNIAAAKVETMIGALKHIGKRYLGWIGVGLMIYEFVQCVY